MAERRPVERFLCDVMLGRLARWLRTLGYDTAYDAGAADLDLVCRAARERRVLLTRDTRIDPNPGTRIWLVRSTRPLEQVREVVGRHGVAPPPGRFRRCTLCNTALRRARPEQIAAKVPDFVRATCQDFSACPSCGRVYWPGSHRKKMSRSLEEILPSLQAARRDSRPREQK